MKHTVSVHGKSYDVDVYQLSKTVWEAVGAFDQVLVRPGPTEEVIRAKGRTENAALKHWRDIARYRGN